ncbi:PTS system, mannitol-specific IIA component [Williamsoniiplasma luminosum]|uniref:PTS system, mannitol-specific IIA component n=1 Tax=Williamsoniiplasma luminosum TaxID=214888 RepID=A0A2K8NU87_9MOLU|nr:PTS sugar transporter subunit IIA [Williamsoniiplasma luminosum]ATZ17334.1 PTS system, mannitol-specific IIA component [Williamsoniiplasma luminosum]
MKKERQNKILYIFLSYKTINKYTLKNHLDISFKTLDRDINDLNDFLKPIKTYISKIDDNYILMNAQTHLILNFTKLNDEFLMISERLIFIILEILKNEHVQQARLLEDLQISKNILVEDLQKLKIILEKYDLELLWEKKGITIPDLSIEKLIPIISNNAVDIIFLKKNSTLLQYGDLSQLFSEYIYKKLVRYFKIDNFKIIYNHLVNLIIDQQNLSEINIAIMAMKITFYLNHSKNKNLNLLDSINFKKDLNNLYLSPHDQNILNSIWLKEDYKTNILSCVQEIENEIEKLFHHKLLLDEYIEERLTQHLIANIFNDKVDDLIIEEYKQNLYKYKNNYFEIFTIIALAIEKNFANQDLNLALTYELFIHIIIYLNTLLANVEAKILAVCVGGMGQSFMLKSFLKSLYPKSEIETSSLSLINKKKLPEYDLVISTIDIGNYKNANLIQFPIASILSQREQLSFFINLKIYEKLIGHNKIKKIFSPENVLINQNAKTKEEAILKCGNLLKELGYITDEYIDSMLERERHFSTYIGNWIAICHGMDGRGVLDNGIVIIHFEKPIMFEDQPTHFLVGLSAKNSQYNDFFEKMSIKLLEIDFVEELLKHPSRERIFKEFEL